MATRNFWLDLFTGKTWQEFLDAGACVSGFRDVRKKMVEQIQPGDYLLCYLTGLSRWIGVLEVTSTAYQDTTPIWQDSTFPCRLKVKPVVTLTPETALPVLEMRDQLSIFQNLSSPFAWTGHFRGSPARMKATDGEAVVNAILDAQRVPTLRPVDRAKLNRRPHALRANKLGEVTIPEREEATNNGYGPAMDRQHKDDSKEPTLHTEIQWKLLKLGSDMGLDVWVARNDRGRDFSGQPFTAIPKLKLDLPLQFDEATNRTIELIDVLWLKGNAIVAAFEIECTTTIYSGLLRMADLIAMQPNLNIPLYLVAPEERRDKVIIEINRPTFSKLTPPMKEMCRFISIPVFQESMTQVASVVRYLKPEFLQELSETCELEDV